MLRQQTNTNRNVARCMGKFLRTHQPIAALLPEDWPTLPANLLTDPGHVLDHLLARHDAESDGRSPRGAHPTPPRLADSIISSEMLEATIQPKVKKQTTNMHLADLPPGFQKHIKKLNFPPSEEEVTLDEDALDAVKRNERTSSGIPLPFSDMSCGGGIFHARMLRKHSELFEGQSSDLRKEDTERLIRGFQLVDVDELVVRSTRRRLLLEAIRLDLVALSGEQEGKLSREVVENILEENIVCSDTLQEDWPWAQAPRLIISNPPWLRIKDRFRGMDDGSQRRKDLSEKLRSLSNENDHDSQPCVETSTSTDFSLNAVCKFSQMTVTCASLHQTVSCVNNHRILYESCSSRSIRGMRFGLLKKQIYCSLV